MTEKFQDINQFKADVVVVGAGVIGCACAYEMSKRGLRVLLLEKGDVASGASGASAAMLEAQLDAHRGNPIFKFLKASDYLFPSLHEELKNLTGLDFRYEKSGILRIAENADDVEFLQNEQKRLKRLGSQSEWKSPADLKKELPQLEKTNLGGLYFQQDGNVDGKILTQALLAGAQKNGARFVPNVGETRLILGSDNHVKIRNAHFEKGSPYFVIAAGAWCDQVLENFKVKLGVEPIRGQLIHFETPEPLLPFPVYTRNQGYLTPKQGVTLAGSTVERVGFDNRTTEEGIRALEKFAFDLLPELKNAKVRAITAGLRPGSPDDLPLIGPLPDFSNVLIATAHYRNGILLAPITAKLIADFVEGKIKEDVVKPLLPERIFSPKI